MVLSFTFIESVLPVSPLQTDYNSLLQPPDSSHWFGTDYLGRDVLARVLWGGRYSLGVAFSGAMVTILCGSLIGLIAGYSGGITDIVLMRIVDIWLAFPTLLILLSVVSILGPGLLTVLLALGISAMPKCIRVVRGLVIVTKRSDYILASKALGASGIQILRFHIIPNIAPFIILYAVIQLSGFLMLTSGLSFFGLGAQPPTPEWGALLNEGRSFYRHSWWLLVFPGLALFVAGLWINFLAEGLREIWFTRHTD